MTVLAEAFPPGDFIREELEARGWTQADLAEIMARPVETINRLVTGKLAITPETARGLGAAFGTSAELWMNLDSSFRLAQVDSDEAVARRARLYGLAPIKDMIRRGWIASSSNVDVLEKQVVEFFELRDLSDEPRMEMAARKSTEYGSATTEQLTWYYAARRLAREVDANAYSKTKLKGALAELRALASHPNEARKVAPVLASVGVRFVVVEHLSKSKIDGAAFWLDAKATLPAIALSLRYDRIDGFWHTLFHEVCHILEGDASVVDVDLVGNAELTSDERPEAERRADDFASNILVPKAELDDFICRIRPLYSKKRIVGFANRLFIHPGIVVGQLQHRREISFSHSREMLVKVRDVVTSSTRTDGWGNSPV